MNQPNEIKTHVKNPQLVERRRRQIVDAAVHLFIENGFHKTTTRQIARASGISVGTLYEYVATKEDILYLVCEAIHAEVERGVSHALAKATSGKHALGAVVHEYFQVCQRMSDHILLIYQETQSLPPQWRRRVLENEVRITGLFVEVIARLIGSGALPQIDEARVELLAHDITVMGHMWTFRRWFLARHYSLEDYIAFQTDLFLGIFSQSAATPFPAQFAAAKEE